MLYREKISRILDRCPSSSSSEGAKLRAKGTPPWRRESLEIQKHFAISSPERPFLTGFEVHHRDEKYPTSRFETKTNRTEERESSKSTIDNLYLPYPIGAKLPSVVNATLWPKLVPNSGQFTAPTRPDRQRFAFVTNLSRTRFNIAGSNVSRRRNEKLTFEKL